MPDPDNLTALHDLQLASGVRDVRAFVGRPRAVRAAISKAYGGDIHAFAALDRSAHQQFTTMLNVYERNLVSEESMAVSLAREGEPRERMLSELDLSKAAAPATALHRGSGRQLPRNPERAHHADREHPAGFARPFGPSCPSGEENLRAHRPTGGLRPRRS